MRHLIDTYIRAEESEKISAFDDMSLIQLIVERGPDAVNALPKGIKDHNEAVAETIENNVRKLIINESPVDPAYYEKMSPAARCPDRATAQGRRELQGISGEDRRAVTNRYHAAGRYAGRLSGNNQDAGAACPVQNLGNDEGKALAVDAAIRNGLQDGWRSNWPKPSACATPSAPCSATRH